MTEANLVDLLTAAGVLLANYWLYKLNGKFDHLAGRVDAVPAGVPAQPVEVRQGRRWGVTGESAG